MITENYADDLLTWSKGKLMFKKKRPAINCWKKWFVKESRDKETWKASINYSHHSLS